jgi:dipeptidase D
MKYGYDWQDDELIITAIGKSTHSSEPQHGTNAIAHLAALLSDSLWPNNASSALVNFINAHLGTGIYGELFGKIAFKDDFMGPMTVALTVLTQKDHGIELSINLRQPRDKTLEQLTEEINQTLIQWQQKNQVNLLNIDEDISEPFVQTDAPQVPTLLAVFAHYTGIKDAQPISIGAGTNSRLFPTAVVFGPAMPGKPYTGHSEHEFVSVEQFVFNLKMYTAAMVELAGEP